MDKITLSKPILINGNEVKEFTYSVEDIGVEQFLEADARAAGKAAALSQGSLRVAETDTSLQLYLGMMAILAVNHEVDITDLERITGSDMMLLIRIGRLFTFRSAEEELEQAEPDSAEKLSEKQSETIAEPITQKEKE